MMTLSRFSFSGITQAACLLVLVGGLYINSVSAVELVGKPVPLSSSDANNSSVVAEPDEEHEAEWSEDSSAPAALMPAQVDMAQPQVAQPFGVNKYMAADGDDRVVQLFAIVFAIGGPLLLIIALVAMHYRAKERREKNINANIERLLAAGRDIPIELLRGDEPYVGAESALDRDERQLQKGIKNVCLGVGLFICLTIIFGIEFGAIGFILLSIGASQLWIWKLSASRKDQIQNPG